MCSKYDNDSRLSNGHHWHDLYDHLMSTNIKTLMMNETLYEQKL